MGENFWLKRKEVIESLKGFKIPVEVIGNMPEKDQELALQQLRDAPLGGTTYTAKKIIKKFTNY